MENKLKVKSLHFKKINWGFLIATLVVIIGAFTMLFPYLWMLLTSFKTTTEAWASPPTIFPAKWLTEAYSNIFADENFYKSIVNTLIIEVSVILVGTFFATLAAYSFAKIKFKHKKFWLLLLMSSMMVPYATVMLPQYRAFQSIGLTETLWPLILPGLFGNVSMMFFLITYMKEGIPDALIESAEIDGASHIKTFLLVGLPLSKPAIAAHAIFWFVGIWNDFFGPSIYLTNPEKLTLQVYLSTLLDANAAGVELPIIMAGSVLASLPMMIIFFSFQNFFINSIALSGMKE
jgi:multiple sugar transport system permease protein